MLGIREFSRVYEYIPKILSWLMFFLLCYDTGYQVYRCIDLNTITRNLYNKLGEEATKKYHMIFPANMYRNYPEGKDDHTHLVYNGALMVAELFVKEIYKTNDPIKDCFLDLSQKEEIDWAMLKD